MVLQASQKADPHMQAGAACYQARDLEGAIREFSTALAAQPDLTPATFNLAVVCRDLEQNEKARELFQRVIASGEILADAHNNLGILAVRREAFEEGIRLFRQAIDLRYQFPLAHFNLATVLLRQGYWEEGLREYEWRWQTPTFTPIQCPQPQWDGRRFGGTLLLHTEQGIGDVFQFARFIPTIRERCQRVIFLRPDHLACMFCEGRWGDEIMSPGEISLDRFQATLPLLSAPHVLGIRFDQLPGGESYLTPASRRVDLGAPHVPDCKLRVGLTWGGSPTHVNDAFRSMPISSLRPLLQLPQIAFYSLQMGERADQIVELEDDRDVVRDLRDLQRDFADTAAIVRQLDLVITVDTSVLHLCGALNLPVWGLLSRRSDWRWLHSDRMDSPWYPSLKLFRQSRLNDWAELMDRVASELTSLLHDRSSH